MVFSLTWLPEVLERAGLKVAEQPGWRSRGHGDMGTVRGVMCHHAAGPKNGNMPSLGIVTNGRPGLAGPLSQLCLGRDGTYFIVAAGRASHAGPGKWQGITSGNSSFIGIEAENTGLADDHPWPAVQMDAYARGVAAILTHIGAKPIMAAAHLEYALPAGRKPDPSFSVGTREQRIAAMKQFRADIAAIMDGTAAPPVPIPPQDDKDRPTLRRGARGDLVKEIQKAVGVDPDGVFGAGTEAAVTQFQRDHGMVPDGIVGPKTWAAFD
jgi:N-acetylmuramoyl-L-alanine amidase/Putative peptidoglycan binding domain